MIHWGLYLRCPIYGTYHLQEFKILGGGRAWDSGLQVKGLRIQVDGLGRF